MEMDAAAIEFLSPWPAKMNLSVKLSLLQPSPCVRAAEIADAEDRAPEAKSEAIHRPGK